MSDRKTSDAIDYMFSEEGQHEYKQWRAKERARYHAARFRRAADRHDRRIPFETRVAVLERANEHCEHCGCFIATGFTRCLELHHLTYERAYHAELPEDLMALCRDCHAATHGMRP